MGAGSVGVASGAWSCGVVGVGRDLRVDFSGAGACSVTAGCTGAGGTPVGPWSPVVPLPSFTARAARILFAVTMKSCQISAGKVPPATGSPWYSVCIGFAPSGYPTQTATVRSSSNPTNHASW